MANDVLPTPWGVLTRQSNIGLGIRYGHGDRQAGENSYEDSPWTHGGECLTFRFETAIRRAVFPGARWGHRDTPGIGWVLVGGAAGHAKEPRTTASPPISPQRGVGFGTGVQGTLAPVSTVFRACSLFLVRRRLPLGSRCGTVLCLDG